MLVSCIVTTYNRPDLVLGALESIFAQSYTQLDVILVDDCSVKSYEHVMAKYKGRVTFLKTKRNSGGGGSAGRNVGIDAAKGEFIAFLDDDDRWMPSKIERQVEFLNSNPSLVACATAHINSVSKVKRILPILTIDLAMLIKKNFIGSPSKFMVRRESTFDCKFDENLSQAEDWDYYLQIASIAPIGYLKEPLMLYNTDDHERMTNTFATLDESQIAVKTKAVEKNRKLIGEKNYKLRICSYYMTGIKKRKNKIEQIYLAIKKVGLFSFISFCYYKQKDLI